MLLAALGAAALAGSGGAVEGWRHSPDFPNGVSGYWGMVATRMPSGSPVYVRPECPLPAGFGGPIPKGFAAVRVIQCGMTAGDGAQEVTNPKAVQALVAAYRTTHTREWISSEMFCAAYADSDPRIAFVDAHGVAIMAAAPRDTCDHVVGAVRDARTPWTGTATVPAP